MCLRSEEGVFSGCKSHSIRIAYDIDLSLDFFPPARVLVYFLKSLCRSFVYIVVAGDIW